MTISVSRALSKAVLDTAPFNAAMDACLLHVYSGDVPQNTDAGLPDAEAALGAAVLLCTYSDNDSGDGLTWETAAVNNVIAKDAAQVWKGTVLADGLASFFRIVLPADTGAASTTDLRIQGSVGNIAADLLVAEPTYATDEERVISSFFAALL